MRHRTLISLAAIPVILGIGYLLGTPEPTPIAAEPRTPPTPVAECRWTDSPITLDVYAAAFYASVRPHLIELPPDARTMLERIIRYDLLGSYVRVDGVEHALRRISTYLNSRWRRPFALDQGVRDLLAHDAAFAADFDEFFPALQAHVASLTPRT